MALLKTNFARGVCKEVSGEDLHLHSLQPGVRPELTWEIPSSAGHGCSPPASVNLCGSYGRMSLRNASFLQAECLGEVNVPEGSRKLNKQTLLS